MRWLSGEVAPSPTVSPAHEATAMTAMRAYCTSGRGMTDPQGLFFSRDAVLSEHPYPPQGRYC